MGRIAQALDLVLDPGSPRVGVGEEIGDSESAVRTQAPAHLLQNRCWVLEVVQREPRDNDVEAPVEERQRTRVPAHPTARPTDTTPLGDQMTAFAQFELRRITRDSRFLFFLFVMPAALYLLYSGLPTHGLQDNLKPAQALMIAMISYAAMGCAMYAIGPELATDRASGWIRQLRITPLTGRAWVAAKTAEGALLPIPAAALVAITATVTHGIHTTPAHWAALLVVVIVGSLPFSMLGIVIGQALDGKAANSGTLFCQLGLAFVGGVLIPFSALPQAARRIGQAFPSCDLAALGRDAFAGRPLPFGDLAVLAAWTLVLAVAGVALLRRDGSSS